MAQRPNELPENFWTVPAPQALTALDSMAGGLTATEAARRLAVIGPNQASATRPRRLLARIFRRIAEPLVAILLAAAVISGVTGDIASFVIILAILAVSITLDVVQEHRAEATAEALQRSVAVHCEVLRDGKLVQVPTEEVVPGDVVELRAGDLVPADGIVLTSNAALANEALLTGEPYPVEKRTGPSASDAPAEASGALFGGTAMVGGEATMLVVATGARTRFGAIAAALRADAPPTAFERGLRSLGGLILRLTVFLTLFVLLTHLAFGRPALEAFLFAVALAVGLTPELLPMVTTVTLARGAQRMAARRVVVKRLSAIHDLGAMDVLCTDKTGTLTQARIALAGHPGPDGADDARVLELAVVNSRFSGGVRSPMDEAILADTTAPPADGWRRIAAIPFDFERRRASVLVEHDGARLLVVKGAPEEVLALAVAALGPDGQPMPLDGAMRQRLAALIDARAAEGLRCLAVAWRAMPADCNTATATDEVELVFAGLCVFADPPKDSAGAAITRLHAAGIRVKIVSGDAAPVLAHLVETLHLPCRGMLTGAEIAKLSDTALGAQVQRVDVFARVSPDQKTRIIKALQARGHVVGFLGDGINDAPAIHAADAGMSVEGATEVARAAADMILLSPDLGVVVDGVVEGRRTYANIMKYVRMGTSSNFGNMLSMAVASVFIPFLPLLAAQVLLNNLLYDLSEAGIPFDDVDPREVARPHGWDMAGVLRFTLVMGGLSSVFDLLTFAVLIWGFDAGPEEFRTAWFLESMASQILVVFLIRTTLPLWTSRPHPALLATSLGALAVAIALALGPLREVLGFTALPAGLLLAVVGLTVIYLVLAEWLKRVASRPSRRHARPAHSR